MNKTEQAKAIIAAMKGAARKDVLQKLIDKVGLTPAGASTYYHKLKAQAAYTAAVLNVTAMSNKELVETFNANGGNVTRFRDRQTGLKRLMALLDEKGINYA